jgi:ParB-like chromosome segregation protein Spo0J
MMVAALRIGRVAPLIVLKLSEVAFCIIDGHRRYAGARALEQPSLPCLVYCLPDTQFPAIEW